MAITLQCPRLRCRAILRVPDNTRGKLVRCSECGSAFVVPSSGKPTVATRTPAEKPASK